MAENHSGSGVVFRRALAVVAAMALLTSLAQVAAAEPSTEEKLDAAKAEFEQLKNQIASQQQVLNRLSAEAAVIAKAIGISEADLRDQLRSGKTIADVAKAKGVDAQKVIDALVADISHRIDQAVTDKHITADRAASIKQGLTDRITKLVNEGGRFKGRPFGGRGGGVRGGGVRGGGFRRGPGGPPPGGVPPAGVLN